MKRTIINTLLLMIVIATIMIIAFYLPWLAIGIILFLQFIIIIILSAKNSQP